MVNPAESAGTIKQVATAAAGPLLDILIIGGGLSGLVVANQIHRTSAATWKLLEARPVLGGRLANENGITDFHKIDMGGAWIWPNHQPFVRRLASDLNIPTFRQPDDPSSTRIEGGAVTFIHALAKELPSENVLLNAPVTECSLVAAADSSSSTTIEEVYTDDSTGETNDGPIIRVQTVFTDKDYDTTTTNTYYAKRVVIAAPPRVVSEHVTFTPPLSKEKQHAMKMSHTWMAGVTKVALLYPTRFWSTDSSNMGFPVGRGPAFQVYDSSTKDGSVAALTFFAMVPPAATAALDDDAVLADQVSDQLADMWNYYRLPFAAQAKSYTTFLIKRWPLEAYISEDAAPTVLHPHPLPNRVLSQKEWKNDVLLFAGSETDRTSPGVMEGAVGAAMRVVYELQAIFGKK